MSRLSYLGSQTHRYYSSLASQLSSSSIFLTLDFYVYQAYHTCIFQIIPGKKL